MDPDQSSVPPAAEPDVPPEQADDPAADAPLNRAARRGKRADPATTGAHGRNGAPHSRGAQGRRVNPVRRTG